MFSTAPKIHLKVEQPPSQPDISKLQLEGAANRGFNGNILLACSNDGEVVCMHFQTGVLGTPCTEHEKRMIIEKMYGRTVLEEYAKNKKYH